MGRLENAVNGEGIRRKVEVERGEGKKIYLPTHAPSPPSLPFVTRAPKPVQTHRMKHFFLVFQKFLFESDVH